MFPDCCEILDTKRSLALHSGDPKSSKKLSTVTCHVIDAYGNTATNVIHAYRAGGECVVGMLNDSRNAQ